MSTTTLNDNSKALLSRPVFASFALIRSDGKPHVTPVWVDVDGDTILVNTAMGRSKAKHVHENSDVAISATDPDNPYSAVAFLGRVTGVTEEGADAHIDALAKKYLGLDSYPNRQPGERRVKISIKPIEVWMQPMG